MPFKSNSTAIGTAQETKQQMNKHKPINTSWDAYLKLMFHAYMRERKLFTTELNLSSLQKKRLYDRTQQSSRQDSPIINRRTAQDQPEGRAILEQLRQKAQQKQAQYTGSTAETAQKDNTEETKTQEATQKNNILEQLRKKAQENKQRYSTA